MSCVVGDQYPTAGERGGDLTRRLLAIGHPYVGRAKTVRPAAVVGEVVALLHRSLPPGVDKEVRDDEHQAVVDVDPARLEAVILNLAVNSWQRSTHRVSSRSVSDTCLRRTR